MHLTSTQLCRLANIPSDRFETLVRRGKLERIFEPAIDGGKWGRYTLVDLLNLCGVVTLNREGVSVQAAVEMVSNTALADAFIAYNGSEPFFVAAYQSGFAEPSKGHLRGPRTDVFEQIPLDAHLIKMMDVTEMAVALDLRAKKLGFTIIAGVIQQASRG